MTIWHVTLGAITLAWASYCSAHTISGDYINPGRDFVELLQITVKADGDLVGTLTRSTLKPNGSLSNERTPVTGAVDEHTITIVTRAPSSSFSGSFDSGAIALILPKGVAHFTATDPAAFQTAVRHLKEQGVMIERQHHAEEENKDVAKLNKQLSDYAAGVQSSRAVQQLQEFHINHKKALASAQRGLTAQQRYPRNSVPASQISVKISQIAVGLRSYDDRWEPTIKQGPIHLRTLDAAIANSPCTRSTLSLSNCGAQPAAIRAYQAVKPIVEHRVADIDRTLKADRSAMDTILKQADAYDR